MLKLLSLTKSTTTFSSSNAELPKPLLYKNLTKSGLSIKNANTQGKAISHEIFRAFFDLASQPDLSLELKLEATLGKIAVDKDDDITIGKLTSEPTTPSSSPNKLVATGVEIVAFDNSQMASELSIAPTSGIIILLSIIGTVVLIKRLKLSFVVNFLTLFDI